MRCVEGIPLRGSSVFRVSRHRDSYLVLFGNRAMLLKWTDGRDELMESS